MNKKEAQALIIENSELKKRVEYLKQRNESEHITSIPIDRICLDSIREDESIDNALFLRLVSSIREYGQIEPVIIKRLIRTSSASTDYYSLLSGYLRIKALKVLGEETVKAIIWSDDILIGSEISFVSNNYRQCNSIFERADIIKSLYLSLGKDYESLSEHISLPRNEIDIYLLISNMSAESRTMCRHYGINDAQIRILSGITDENLLHTAIRHIGKAKLSYEQTIDYIYDMLDIETVIPENKALNKKMILKDIRFLYNSIDNIVDTLKESNIQYIYEKNEEADGFVIHLKIKKAK